MTATQIGPNQHWPPQPGDAYYAEAAKVDRGEGWIVRWVVRRRTPACVWFSYHENEELAQAAIQRFYKNHDLPPEHRARLAELRRARLEARLTDLLKELEDSV